MEVRRVVQGSASKPIPGVDVDPHTEKIPNEGCLPGPGRVVQRRPAQLVHSRAGVFARPKAGRDRLLFRKVEELVRAPVPAGVPGLGGGGYGGRGVLGTNRNGQGWKQCPHHRGACCNLWRRPSRRLHLYPSCWISAAYALSIGPVPDCVQSRSRMLTNLARPLASIGDPFPFRPQVLARVGSVFQLRNAPAPLCGNRAVRHRCRARTKRVRRNTRTIAMVQGTQEGTGNGFRNRVRGGVPDTPDSQRRES